MDGSYSAAIFGRDGRDVSVVDLPARGHGFAVCKQTGRCVAFGRRPGAVAVAFSPVDRHPPVIFEAPEDRHFYGHGIFSPDGRLLYATENDFEGAQGVIGIYDATAAFRRIGEFSSHGVGPHDLALLDGRTLVIANGGLREHPDIGRGRRVLNLDTIETSLAYVDVATGDLLERHVIAPCGALSLRHMGVGRDGTVILGAQVVDGAPGAAVSRAGADLIYRHRRQSLLAAIQLGGESEGALAGYVSSVAVDGAGEVAALTSSKGGVVLTVDILSGRVLGRTGLADVSGIAAGVRTGSFLATSGTGAIAGEMTVGTVAGEIVHSRWQWDNHAVRVS